MDERDVVRDLVSKLIEAVEASLDGSPAVREALDELVRNGFEPRLILLGGRGRPLELTGDETAEDAPECRSTRTAAPDVGEAVEDDLEEAHDLRYELTKLDRDFLRTVRIQPESG